jgi:hypothetical protein
MNMDEIERADTKADIFMQGMREILGVTFVLLCSKCGAEFSDDLTGREALVSHPCPETTGKQIT